MGIDGGFDGGFNIGFNGGLFDQFPFAVLGYWPQQSIQQLRWEAFTAISWEALTGLSLNKLIILQVIIIVT